MLTVKRPSKTTVLYKVSTRSPNNTLPARLRRILIGIIRIILGLSILCILVAKTHLSLSSRWKTHTDYASAFLPQRLSHFSTTAATYIPWIYLVPASLAIGSLVFRKGYTTESLLVIRGLGVQTTTSSATYLSTATTRFIPTNMIQDIFIHEAFKGFEVRFYLAIVVEGEHDVVVVFPVSFAVSLIYGLLVLTRRLRTFCPEDRFWNRFGEAQGCVCMSQRLDCGLMSIHRHPPSAVSWAYKGLFSPDIWHSPPRRAPSSVSQTRARSFLQAWANHRRQKS